MAKKKARKTSKPAARAPQTINVKLSPAQQREADKCLERSGKIVIGFKDISVTRLPKKIKPQMDVKD